MRFLTYFIVLLIAFGFFSCQDILPDENANPIKAGLSEYCTFVDLTPDMEIPTSDYPGYEGYQEPFDIDNNGTDDFAFGYFRYAGNQGNNRTFSIVPLNSEVLFVVVDSNPKIFNVEDEISCDANFISDRLVIYEHDVTYSHASDSGEDEIVETGIWKDVDRKCIAFKFLSAGVWKIGWIKIGLANNNQDLIVYEYAYSKESGC